MAGVRYTLVESNTTDVPSVAGGTHSRGFNLPGGSVDEVIVRLQFTLNAAGNISADTSNLISQFRLILNGETVTDFQAGYTDNTNDAPGIFGYFLNSMGRGRSVEVNSQDATRTAFFRIPVGRNIPAGISRMEYTLQYAALTGAGGEPTAASIEWWVRYNSSMQNTTTIGAATTQTLAATTQLVSVKVPQNVPGTLAGILIQNDRANDGDITEARVVSQSDFSLDVAYWRALNGDLYNGIEFMDPATADGLEFAQSVAGVLFLPLFNLSMNSDLRLQLTATAARVVSIIPVIVSPIAGKPQPAQVQTLSVPTNVSSSILDDSKAEV
tara:strand:- start:245 stop:1222 length:978 start_codon:yes stop_codon:yes gene_type:complete